jgi:alanyl-tRNA synthetase
MTEENPEVVTEPTPNPEELGDAGKRAIAAERRRADALDKELKAFKAEAEKRANAELTELERFKKENEELRGAKTASELEAIRLSVALEKGIPANLAARLQGTDRESIAADADSLAELVGNKPTGQVRPDPSQGPKSTVTEQTPAQAFAAHLNAQLK